MKKLHNTLILAAGNNIFQTEKSGSISKYNFEVAGVKLIERVLTTYDTGNTRIVVSGDDFARIHENFEGQIVSVGNTQGALISALLGLKDCDLSLPLFITPGDSLIKPEKYQDFYTESLRSENQISLVVFDSDNTKYSYIRILDGKLIEVCEKKVISSMATAGIFYFKSAQIFVDCAEWAVMNNIRNRESFFLAPALNYAVIMGLTPDLFRIDEGDYFRFSSFAEAVESGKRYSNASK